MGFHFHNLHVQCRESSNCSVKLLLWEVKITLNTYTFIPYSLLFSGSIGTKNKLILWTYTWPSKSQIRGLTTFVLMQAKHNGSPVGEEDCAIHTSAWLTNYSRAKYHSWRNRVYLYRSYSKPILKCHYGFSKNDFSGKSDQWRAREKKIFRIGFVVCQQFTFKIRRFRFTTAQTEARERMTSKEELTPSDLSRFQLFTRTEHTTVQAFQGLS